LSSKSDWTFRQRKIIIRPIFRELSGYKVLIPECSTKKIRVNQIIKIRKMKPFNPYILFIVREKAFIFPNPFQLSLNKSAIKDFARLNAFMEVKSCLVFL